jgi:hypothetical protein
MFYVLKNDADRVVTEVQGNYGSGEAPQMACQQTKINRKFGSIL